MPSGRSIAAFAVKFLVIYGALAASWPLCRSAYALFLSRGGQVLIEAVGARDYVRIQSTPSPNGMYDTVLSMRPMQLFADGKILQITVSSWLVGFQPTSLLIGLVVATPVSMRRRLWALFVGLVMVHAFIIARLATVLIIAPLVQPDTFWNNVLRSSVLNFIHRHAVSCFVPVLIWIVVTVRWDDVRRFVGPTPKKLTT